MSDKGLHPVCEGSCEEHGEVVGRVHVVHASGYDWGYFWYCSSAIAEDEKRGFVVTPADKESPDA